MCNAISLHSSNCPVFQVKEVEQYALLNYVHLLSNSNKFYIMEFHEGTGDYPYRIYTEYGRLDRSPRQEGRYFHDRMKAKNEFHRLLSSKLKKGYEQIFVDEILDASIYSQHEIKTRIHSTKTDKVNDIPTIETPFGHLSLIQVQRGLDTLNQIKESIHLGQREVLRLSNLFYSMIPIAFGSQINVKAYLLDTNEKIQEKIDWLMEMKTVLKEEEPIAFIWDDVWNLEMN